MRPKWARLLWTMAAACAGLAAAVATASPATVARSCHAGSVHAVVRGSEKCLRAGEFCVHAEDALYRRYGFRCLRYDARAHRYRLTRR